MSDGWHSHGDTGLGNRTMGARHQMATSLGRHYEPRTQGIQLQDRRGEGAMVEGVAQHNSIFLLVGPLL